jgi:hypothetical protein
LLSFKHRQFSFTFSFKVKEPKVYVSYRLPSFLGETS